MLWLAEKGKVAWALILVGCFNLTLVGCTTTPSKEEQIRPAWPSPPQQPRIKFVRSIVGEEDLKQDTTFSQTVTDFLTGVKPPPKRIVEPMGIAVSDNGERLYVSNFRGYVFVFDFAQKTFTKIEPLAYPAGLALDGDANLYVVEQAKAQISVFDKTGNKLRTFLHPDLIRPTGIAIDQKRKKIYVVDTGHGGAITEKSTGHNVKIFDMDGGLIGQIGNHRGSAPGQFSFPTYATLDAKGNLYVTDTLNARIQVFDPDGKYIKSVGQRGNAWGMFDKPKGVALDSFGNVYVADSGWSNVQIFNPNNQVLLFFGGRGPLPGMMKNPTAVAIDATNHIYVADFINHRINVYQLVNTTAEDSFINPLQNVSGSNLENVKSEARGASDRPN